MRSVVVLVRSAAAVWLACSAACAQAGVIEILRGDPAEPAPLRRVAFVGSATVREVQGTAERLAGIDRWTPLRPGTKLAPGDIIRTGQGSVVLRMTESGSFVKVTPRVMLRLAPFETGWDRGVLSGMEEREGFAVRACRGQAGYKLANGEWQPVVVNDVLPEGATVRLAKGAVVDLYNTVDRKSLRLAGDADTVLTSRNSLQPALAAVAP